MSEQYFLDMIVQIREKEEIVLYDSKAVAGEEENEKVLAFLATDYERESISYPGVAPVFDGGAALWAAQVLYQAAQLVLQRDDHPQKLEERFPPYDGEMTASAVLSADLCLRFLPPLMVQLKMINSEDALMSILEKILRIWHYSGIAYRDEEMIPDRSIAHTNACLEKMYVNRIIATKNLSLAMAPGFRELVKADLGIFGDELWNSFKTATAIHEQH